MSSDNLGRLSRGALGKRKEKGHRHRPHSHRKAGAPTASSRKWAWEGQLPFTSAGSLYLTISPR